MDPSCSRKKALDRALEKVEHAGKEKSLSVRYAEDRVPVSIEYEREPPKLDQSSSKSVNAHFDRLIAQKRAQLPMKKYDEKARIPQGMIKNYHEKASELDLAHAKWRESNRPYPKLRKFAQSVGGLSESVRNNVGAYEREKEKKLTDIHKKKLELLSLTDKGFRTKEREAEARARKQYDEEVTQIEHNRRAALQRFGWGSTTDRAVSHVRSSARTVRSWSRSRSTSGTRDI